MAQIIPIVSEALQSTIRRLLPSQSGFGEDLQAQNVIVPIIDLTPSAEGSSLPYNLQEALSFSSQTSGTANGNTVVMANTPGFWRVTGTMNAFSQGGSNGGCSITLSNGLATKLVKQLFIDNSSSTDVTAVNFDLSVFLDTGDSVNAVSDASGSFLTFTARQVATTTGELVNPAGFVVQ